MANTSKLKETFNKYEDCNNKANSYERELWGLIKDFVKKHGRFEFNGYIQGDYEDGGYVEALYCLDEGLGKRECIVRSMYIKDNELVFDIGVKYDVDDCYCHEYNGVSYELEFEDIWLCELVRAIEYSCNKK